MAQSSYVETVPVEVWSEIFQQASKERLLEGTYSQNCFTERDAPISVSQTCARFRQMSVTTPRLWSTIVIDFISSNPSNTLNFIKLWLERSKSSPLSILMYNINGLDMANQQDKRECLATVLFHVCRWKRAALRWKDTDSTFWSSYMKVEPHAPMLESLYLEPKVEETMMERGVLPRMLWSNSPRLRRLAVLLDVVVEDEDEYYPPEEDGYSTWATSYRIPYSVLTHLHLSAFTHEIISRKEMVNIFQLANSLVCCFIQWIGGCDSEPERNLAPVPLNHLKHLYLEPAESSDTHYEIRASQLLDYITAPSLISLTLVRQGIWVSDPFKNFMQRSQCALEELNLIDVSLKVPEVHECMKLTSASLRKLHVGRLSSVDEDIYIKSLTNFNNITLEYELCPRLEQVSLAPYPVAFYGHPPPFSLITQVLASRMDPTMKSLKTFKTLLIPQAWARQIPPDLRKLSEQPFGLTIGFNDEVLEKDSLWIRLAYE